MNKRNKIVIFTIAGILVIFFAIIIILNYEHGAFDTYNGQTPDVFPPLSPYYCTSECRLVSVSNDANLNDTYKGINGSATPIEEIDVSCISEEYYNSNKQYYNYQANVYIPEIDCTCIENKCQIRPIGMVQP